MDVNQTKKSECADDISKDKQNATANMFDCKFIVGHEPGEIETVMGCKFQFAIESPVFERMLFADKKYSLTLKDEIRLPEDDPKDVRLFRLLTCGNSLRDTTLQGLSVSEFVNFTLFCVKYEALSILKLCQDNLQSIFSKAKGKDLYMIFDLMDVFPATRDLYKNALISDAFSLNCTISMRPEGMTRFVAFLCDVKAQMTITKVMVNIFRVIETYLNHHELIPKVLLDDDKCLKDTLNGNKLIKKYESEQDKQKFLIKLLKLLDFSCMTVACFFEGPSESKILTTSQKYFILSRLCEKPIKSIKLYDETD